MNHNKPLLIISEGIDRIGKTTNVVKQLVDKLDLLAFGNKENSDFIPQFKWEKTIIDFDPRFYEINFAAYGTFIDMITRINHYTGKGIVLDRYHLSCMVYSVYNRPESVYNIFGNVFNMFELSNTIERILMSYFDVHMLVFCMKSDKDAKGDGNWTSDENAEINERYREYFNYSEIENKNLFELELDESNMTDIHRYVTEFIKYIKTTRR